jgi:hypothetical protein
MDQRTSGDPTIVVATADPERLDQVLSILAAVGLEAVVVSDPGSLRSFWSSAAMVLVGVDHAPRSRDWAWPGARRSTCSGRLTPRPRPTSGRCRWARP